MNCKFKTFRQPSNQAGFTIIEILIALVVVGIITALVFVGYNGIQRSNAATVLKANLQQAQVELENYRWDKGGYPESTNDLNNNTGLRASDDVVFTYSRVGTGYCLTASSPKALLSLYITGGDSVAKDGLCPGHTGNPGFPNLALNSSFEKSAGTTSEVMRNHFIYPGGTTSSSSYSEAWAGTDNSRVLSVTESNWSHSGTQLQIEYTTVTNPNSGSFGIRPRNGTEFVPVGEKWTMSYYIVRLTEAGPLSAPTLAQASGYTKHGGSSAVTAQAGEAVKVWLTFTINSAPPSNIRVSVNTNEKSVGSQFAISDIDLYPGDYQPDREWFNGTKSVIPDYETMWVGTQDASQSVAFGRAADDTSPMQNGIQMVSSEWSNSGNLSLRMIPTSTVSSDNSVTVAGSPGSGMSGRGITFVPGKTYTALATVRLKSPQLSPTGSRARSIQFVSNTVQGWTGASSVMSAMPPNIAGEHKVRVTFTVPSDAVWAGVRLYNGALAGNGEVWWDDFYLVEGAYDGPHFE